MSWLRRRRLENGAAAVAYLLDGIHELELMRSSCKDHLAKATVLAINHAVVSHASRALSQLNRAEELARRGQGSLQSGERLRHYLTSRLELPAVSLHTLGNTPEEEIERLYQKWQEADRLVLSLRPSFCGLHDAYSGGLAVQKRRP